MRIYRNSLSRTIDSVNESFFFGHDSTQAERDEIAQWIAARQGKPNCYADMFAPTPTEMREGIVLFTGERLGPSASLRHVSGEEACRAVILLGSKAKAVQSSLAGATNAMVTRLSHFQPNKAGMFCCGTCDPALWRHLAVGGLRGAEEWLAIGLKALKAHRDGNGKWRRFPFFYTMLALLEIDDPKAIAEMRYAAPTGAAYLRRAANTENPDPTRLRRRSVLERAMKLI